MAAFLVVPGAAGAATVHTESRVGEHASELQAVYDAAPGEANRVTVTVNPAGLDFTVSFHDAGAPVQAGRGCVQVGPHRAGCFTGAIDAARVHLGDGDDVLRTNEYKVFQDYFPLHVYGGDGDDVLRGSLNWDFLDGGRGADTLVGGRQEDWIAGGTGSDRISAGPGDDFVTGEKLHAATPASDDAIDAGAGADTVVYYGGRAPVHVDLAARSGGASPTDHDSLRGIEDVALYGGSGVLAGDDRSNEMYAVRHTGRVVIRGRRGDDYLTGGDLADAVYGGPGSDYVEGGGGTGDLLRAGPGDDVVVTPGLGGSTHHGWARPVHCGRGSDEVIFVRRHDVIAPDCEDIATDVRLGISPRLRRVGDDAVELSVHRRGPHRACRYAIALRAPFPQRRDARGRRIGHLVFRQDRKTWRRIRVPLNDYGRSLLRRRSRLPVLVQAGVRQRCGQKAPLFFGVDGFTAML